jgi:enoyl-CoA hydratase
MTDSQLSVRREGQIAVVTLDDGKVNVFSLAMARRLQTCFDELAGSDVGAVVVTGRPGIFSAGFDLKTINSGDPAAVGTMVATTVRMAMYVLAFPRPVVGAATGHAVAMGALFLMTMDHRVGARGDFKIGLNEVRDGLRLPIFAVELARYRLNSTSLTGSALHSKLYNADGAVAAGFLDEAAEPDAVLSTALERAQALAALPNPAYRVSKANLVAPVRQRILETLDADLGSF